MTHTDGGAVGKILDAYFQETREDGYVVDGVDGDEAAARLVDGLASWDFLMALLDRHYPADIFPTGPDRENRDPGPRIVSLIRHLDAARQAMKDVKEALDQLLEVPK